MSTTSPLATGAHAAAVVPRRGRDSWWVVVLTVVGFGLRMATINTRGLWLDEGATIEQTTSSVWDTIQSVVGGTHPPLFHILMNFWIGAFGTGEVAVKSFALVFGVAAIPVAYWAGARLWDRRTGLVAAALLTFSPYHIWYSQEARMYSMLMFFGLLSVAFFALAVDRNDSRSWVGYTIASLLGAFTHYFFLFLIVGEVAYFLVVEVFIRGSGQRRGGQRTASLRRPWRIFADMPGLGPWLASNTVLVTTVTAWLYWAVWLPSHGANSPLIKSITAGSGGLGYGQVAASFAIRFNDVGQMLVEMIAGFHPAWTMYALVAMWPLLISLAMVLVDVVGPMKRVTAVAVFSCIGFPLIWALGQWQGQVLASRYAMALAAPALLLIARVLAASNKRLGKALISLVVVLSLVAWADQSFDPNNTMRYDNRAAIEFVAEQYRPGDVIIYEPFYMDVLTDYYLPKTIPAFAFPLYGENAGLRNGKVQLGQDLDRVARQSDRVYLILSFQNIAQLRGDAYNTTMWFLRNGFTTTQDVQLSQVQVLRFDRTPVPTSTPAPEASTP
ncbi:MAG TPA: glycosyltransferase family 39 protein [Coriobacteriia bacterium]